MTDQEIYTGVAHKDNKAFLYLYETNLDSVIRLVTKNNGTPDDARDVFQEGLLALWTNVSNGKFEVNDNVKLSTYLYSLCRNIWISRLRKNKVLYSIKDYHQEEIADEVDQMSRHYDRIIMLEKQFQKLGGSCQKLLKLFYFDKAKLKEIAMILGITEKSAKNNKYRCMQTLRTFFNT